MSHTAALDKPVRGRVVLETDLDFTGVDNFTAPIGYNLEQPDLSTAFMGTLEGKGTRGARRGDERERHRGCRAVLHAVRRGGARPGHQQHVCVCGV